MDPNRNIKTVFYGGPNDGEVIYSKELPQLRSQGYVLQQKDNYSCVYVYEGIREVNG